MKYWRKEILLAVILLALFAAVVSVGTVADVQEGRVEELFGKIEQLEAENRGLRADIDDIMSVQGYQIWKERMIDDQWEG